MARLRGHQQRQVPRLSYNAHINLPEVKLQNMHPESGTFFFYFTPSIMLPVIRYDYVKRFMRRKN